MTLLTMLYVVTLCDDDEEEKKDLLPENSHRGYFRRPS